MGIMSASAPPHAPPPTPAMNPELAVSKHLWHGHRSDHESRDGKRGDEQFDHHHPVVTGMRRR
jgi:hypothetical protein